MNRYIPNTVGELDRFHRSLYEWLMRVRDELPDRIATEELIERRTGRAYTVGDPDNAKLRIAFSRILPLAGFEQLSKGGRAYSESFRDSLGAKSTSTWWEKIDLGV